MEDAGELPDRQKKQRDCRRLRAVATDLTLLSALVWPSPAPQWIYILGPTLGALLGAFAYELVAESRRAALVTPMTRAAAAAAAFEPPMPPPFSFEAPLHLAPEPEPELDPSAKSPNNEETLDTTSA